MVYSKVNTKIFYSGKIITVLNSLVGLFLILFIILYDFHAPYFDVPMTILLIIGLVILMFNSFFSLLKYNKFRVAKAIEILDVAIDGAKYFPKKNPPKVVYVYTTHNDFMPARLLQNMEQTYKNFEVWISDGSDNPKTIAEVDEFVKKHPEVKLYRLGGIGSINKAHNLNSFIKYCKVKYDYLLVADADEVFDPHFVDAAIKCFYSKKHYKDKLGWVTVCNVVYLTKNFFVRSFKVWQDIDGIKLQDHNIEFKSCKNLQGCGTLIKKSAIDMFPNKLFPATNLEDGIAEVEIIQNGDDIESLMLPFCIAAQEFDRDAVAYTNRARRIGNWCNLYAANGVRNFVDSRNGIVELYINAKTSTIPTIFRILMLGVGIFLFINCYELFLNPVILTVIPTLLIITLICKIIFSFRATGWIGVWFFFTKLLINEVSFVNAMAENISSFIRKKALGFGGTQKGTIPKTKLMGKLNKIKTHFFFFIIYALIIAILTEVFFILQSTVVPTEYHSILLLFYILFVIIPCKCCYAYLVFMLSYFFSFIPWNKKYSHNDYVDIDPKGLGYEKELRQYCIDKPAAFDMLYGNTIEINEEKIHFAVPPKKISNKKHLTQIIKYDKEFNVFVTNKNKKILFDKIVVKPEKYTTDFKNTLGVQVIDNKLTPVFIENGKEVKMFE